MSVTAREIIDRYPMGRLLADLGFEVPKRGTRAKCRLCGGNGLKFSFNVDRGVFNCFGCGESGGKIALVRRVLNLEPEPSLRWMAERQGLTLDQQSPEEKRAYLQKAHAAKFEAGALVDWRDDLVDALAGHRNELQALHHRAQRYLFAHPGGDGTPAYEAACVINAFYWERVQYLDGALDQVRNADYGQMLPMFREKREMRRTA